MGLASPHVWRTHSAGKEEPAKLVPLFEGELVYDETTEIGFPTYAEDGDWLAYVQGHGSITGERLKGELRWTNHPRRRADGTWLPNYQGTIATADGAHLLFSMAGYNQGIVIRSRTTSAPRSAA